ncbi:metallophosphoesterase family protein [Novosphingobium terrae]|uniref:metallophosphoesterase family protein n=1 Tax=Novosphingobium terrae TaxID=2726189 RepID=UPI00198076C1|nr:metallophosphoesterase family protein [Novosphingobium terrae]
MAYPTSAPLDLPDESDAADVVYAIGDLHGRLDLLEAMEAAIHADIATYPSARALICYLGDYIDRGPHSSRVIDRLCRPFADGVRRIFLKGNHEDRMIDFLHHPDENGPSWMQFGGLQALESYGIIVAGDPAQQDWPQLRDRLFAAMPTEHHGFLSDLGLGMIWRGYVFVHAGLRPGVPLEAQAPHDLMWIREPFLSSDHDWGRIVVHGHVIVKAPQYRTNRIGIDTGAYRSNCLTCLVCDETGHRILQVRG